jgi:ankyrin repeat protein
MFMVSFRFARNEVRILLKDQNGRSLMGSGEQGHVEVVRFLLQSGADKTLKNNRGKTAVQIAQAKGQKEVVKILKEEN